MESRVAAAQHGEKRERCRAIKNVKCERALRAVKISRHIRSIHRPGGGHKLSMLIGRANSLTREEEWRGGVTEQKLKSSRWCVCTTEAQNLSHV